MPHHKLTIGGVKSGDGPTEYSVTIDNIKRKLKYHWKNDGGRDFRDGSNSLLNPKPSVMATLQANWNQDWCETKLEKRKRYFRYRREVSE